jgi:hypothetical protein
MNGNASTATSHSGGSSRRSREPTASATDRRPSVAAISDPASANMTAIAGNTTVSRLAPVA